MRLATTSFVAIIFCAGANLTATAQTVQLPTFNSFSVGTTVIAPDAGISTAGGVRRTGSTWQGYGPLPGGSARSGFAATAGVRAGAVIHDFQQIDSQLLAGADPQNRPRVQNRPNELLAGTLPSVAEIRRRKAQEQAVLSAKPLASDTSKKPRRSAQTALTSPQRSSKSLSAGR